MESLYNHNNSAWLLGGDKNEILWNKEKLGGRPRLSSLMNNFREALNSCGLLDLGYTGDLFTWCNKWRNKPPIYNRLDRFVGNQAFIDLFPNISNLHLDWCRSDHRPIELNIISSAPPNFTSARVPFFRFEEHWMQ